MVRTILFKILGLENYLRLVSRFFFAFYKLGALEGKPEFDFHYFASKVVKKGDQVLDIGANLGYYTRIFAEKVGENGKVLAVEPVELFRRVLSKNTRGLSNIELLPFALGEDDGSEIEMGVPAGHKIFRHGLTHVVESTNEKNSHTFKATMRDPEKLFAGLERLDYIKCDVEGYETHIFPRLIAVIEKFKPFIQIETSGDNKKIIWNLLIGHGYKVFMVRSGKLIELSDPEHESFGDLFFVSESGMEQVSSFISDDQKR